MYVIQAQADERAHRLKVELQRKREEAAQKERRLIELAQKKAQPTPVPITKVLRDIGVKKNEPLRVAPVSSESAQPAVPVVPKP